MPQRINDAGATRIKRRRRLADAVAKDQRPPNYRCRWISAYRAPMGDASAPAEDWASYLRRMTSRPGWSVARLAREAGVNRSTIFGWIKGDGVNVASVKQIAKALGDDEVHALAAAAGTASHGDQLDADVRIILRRLADPTVSDAEKAIFRATLRHLADLADRTERGDEGKGRAAS